MINPLLDPPVASRDIRLHLGVALREGGEIELPRDASHYLSTVMRVGKGETFYVFNGEDGEWLAELCEPHKRAARLRLAVQTRPSCPPPDLWLLFAPIKKARTDFIVEKACELGCRRVLPVITARTRSETVRVDRLQAHAIEAAEQCGLVFVPEVAEPAPLARVLEEWPPERALHFCDEERMARPLGDVAAPPPAAILIGPEGGFSEQEAAQLRARPFLVSASLGPRLLRADTAAAAAIALWQTAQGDWSAAADEGEP